MDSKEICKVALSRTWSILKVGETYIWVAALEVLFLALVWLLYGRDEAMSESRLIVPVIIAFLIPFVLVFLWNLWIEPFRLLENRIAEQKPKQFRKSLLTQSKENLLTDFGALMEHLISLDKLMVNYDLDEHDSEDERRARVLFSRYTSWFPKNYRLSRSFYQSDISFEDRLDWIGQILSVLQDNEDIKIAEIKIKEAAQKGSWD